MMVEREPQAARNTAAFVGWCVAASALSGCIPIPTAHGWGEEPALAVIANDCEDGLIGSVGVYSSDKQSLPVNEELWVEPREVSSIEHRIDLADLVDGELFVWVKSQAGGEWGQPTFTAKVSDLKYTTNENGGRTFIVVVGGDRCPGVSGGSS